VFTHVCLVEHKSVIRKVIVLKVVAFAEFVLIQYLKCIRLACRIFHMHNLDLFLSFFQKSC